MKVRASILFWKGNAYLPTMAPYEYGGWVKIGPVIITSPNMENLVPAIEENMKINMKQQTVMGDDVDNSVDPILDATKARSWYKLAETGASYLINWTDDQIKVYMTLPGKKNKFQLDNDKTQELPADTHIEDILTVILDDLKSRPEALSP